MITKVMKIGIPGESEFLIRPLAKRLVCTDGTYM